MIQNKCLKKFIIGCVVSLSFIGSLPFISSASGFLPAQTSEDFLTGFSEVSTSIFSSASAWLYLVAGLMVAWFIIESLTLIFGDTMERNARLEARKKKK